TRLSKAHSSAATAALVVQDTLDEKLVATASLDKGMAIWRFYNPHKDSESPDESCDESIEVTRLKVPGAPVFSLAKIPEVLPDGTIVRKRRKPPGIYLGTAAKEVITWMLGSKDVTDKVVLGDHTGWVRSLALTGKWLFSCGCNELRLWDTTFRTPKEAQRAVRLFTGDILSLAATRGQVFAAGADGSLHAWTINDRPDRSSAGASSSHSHSSHSNGGGGAGGSHGSSSGSHGGNGASSAGSHGSSSGNGSGSHASHATAGHGGSGGGAANGAHGSSSGSSSSSGNGGGGGGGGSSSSGSGGGGHLLVEGPCVERAHEGRVAACVAHGDRVFTVSYDGSIKAWQASTLTLLAEVRGAHRGEKVICAAVGANGVLFTGGDDKLIRAWDMSLTPVGPPLEGHAASVRVLATGRRGLLVSGDAEGDVCIWETYPVELPPPPPAAAPSSQELATGPYGGEGAAAAAESGAAFVDSSMATTDDEEQQLQQQQGAAGYFAAVAEAVGGAVLVSHEGLPQEQQHPQQYYDHEQQPPGGVEAAAVAGAVATVEPLEAAPPPCGGGDVAEGSLLQQLQQQWQQQHLEAAYEASPAPEGAQAAAVMTPAAAPSQPEAGAGGSPEVAAWVEVAAQAAAMEVVAHAGALEAAAAAAQMEAVMQAAAAAVRQAAAMELAAQREEAGHQSEGAVAATASMEDLAVAAAAAMAAAVTQGERVGEASVV
ncbi:hypothetical protein Agub_g9550, partial [Astrephomene gubernaculifera]